MSTVNYPAFFLAPDVLKYMSEAGDKGFSDQSSLLKKLNPKQRKALELFQQFEVITSHQIGELFANTKACFSNCLNVHVDTTKMSSLKEMVF